MDDKSVTAVDYLEEQLELEREAREVMPYDPDVCTYPKLLRQLVFACLTCLRQNNSANVGVCYLCLIQCHSTHELVELFSKRNFACDCGTSRMHESSGCALRNNPTGGHSITTSETSYQSTSYGLSGNTSHPKVPKLRTGLISESLTFSTSDLPKAEDIPSLENTYNHNFQGKFCSCDMVYNPVQETRTMHQCYLGDVCGEDWFHQDCILGYSPGIFQRNNNTSGVNKLDDLPPPGLEASEDPPLVTPMVDDSGDDVIPHFPDMDTFGEFICWKCVSAHREAFDSLVKFQNVVVKHMPHFNLVMSGDDWKVQYEQYVQGEPQTKRVKREDGAQGISYSVFLAENFKEELKTIRASLLPESALERFLNLFEYVANDDPIYQPAKDDLGSSNSSTGSLYELGSNALQTLPTPQAIEGLHAYGVMKAKLQNFFKGFVDQQKVVTEEEVRRFFDDMKNEQK